MNPYLDKYRAVQASTANPGQLLMMLIEGTLRETTRARIAFEKDQPGETHLLTAVQGVTELDRTLNYEPLPELAESLHKLYLHLLWLLSESLSGRNPEPLARAEALLGKLRDTWQEAILFQASLERKAV